MKYPIPISDTAGLDSPLDYAKVILEPHPNLVGGAAGALVGHLIGKHALVGALLGIVGANLAKEYLLK